MSSGLGFSLAALLFLFIAPCAVQAQVAGMNTLGGLDYSTMSRAAGLGFDCLPLLDGDASVGFDNPSLLDPATSGTAMLSFVPLFGGSNTTALGYVHATQRHGTFSFGALLTNYGRFERVSEEDIEQGGFGAGDYALHIGWGMWIDSCFSVGINVMPILSQYESYTAVAVAFDVAGSYVSHSRRLAATLMLHNIGAQLATFDGTREKLAYEVEAMVSYKLKRAPFRLFFAATELQHWNLAFEDPLHPTTTTDPYTGEVQKQSTVVGLLDNLMRHTQVGVELTLGRSFYARVGYNYRQGAEVRGFDALTLSAISFGAGLRLRKFEVGIARRNYHLGQAATSLTALYKF